MPTLDDVVWESFDESPSWDVSETEPDGWQGAETLRGARRREFRLVNRSMTTVEATTLRSIWDTARGPAGTTTVTPPGEVSSVTVEFVSDRLRLSRATGNTWTADIAVREVL